MAKGDIVVGLDIGTTKVCALVAEVTSETGRVDILGVGVAASTGIRRGVVVDIEQTVRAIEDAIGKAQRMAGVEIHAVIVGVTGEHIASLNSRGVIAITHTDREVTPDDVTRVVESSKVIVLPPDREIVHAIPRGYAIDGQNGIRSPVGMSGTRLEVETHIVTGATSFLRNVVTCVERAHLHVEDLVLEPLATADAVLADAEKEMGVVLVDIGGGTADVAVFRNGDICYSVVVPVGGHYVTRDIAAGLRMSPEEAERVKLAHGTTRAKSVSPDATFRYTLLGTGEEVTETVLTLASIIEPRATETFQLVRRELARSEFASVLPAGMVLSGGGAMLGGMRELGRDITGMPVRVGYPGGVGGLSEAVNSPTFATSVGLVLWGGRLQTGIVRRETESGLLGALLGWLRRIRLSVGRK
ncbi:MAG: cell division protein FtsA [Capsulimonadales bacterium]|nr:cell division protein FtsA [Capsulimonadales bacterium]